MEWWDWLIFGVGAIGTIISIGGACKSLKYFNKIKRLDEYTNLVLCQSEIKNILITCKEVLKKKNPMCQKKGAKIEAVIVANMEEIFNSIVTIKEKIPSQNKKALNNFFIEAFDVFEYVNSIISSAKELQIDFSIDDSFYKMQTYFSSTLDKLKEESENVKSKAK